MCYVVFVALVTLIALLEETEDLYNHEKLPQAIPSHPASFSATEVSAVTFSNEVHHILLLKDSASTQRLLLHLKK